jgi:hypothetical protein
VQNHAAERQTGVVIAPATSAGPTQRIEQGAFSPRAVLIGLACVALTCVLVCYAELVVANIQIGFLQLPPVACGPTSCSRSMG